MTYPLTVQPEDGPILEGIKNHLNQANADFKAALKDHRYKMRQASIINQPAYAPISASGTIASNGTLLLDLGGPQQGRRWAVRLLAYSDASSWSTTMTNALGTVYIGRINTPTVVSPQFAVWPFSTSPNAATFGSDELWITPSDHLYLYITGGNVNQNVQVTAHIQDFDPVNTFEVEGV